MKASHLVAIVIRLFAIYWLVNMVLFFLGMLGTAGFGDLIADHTARRMLAQVSLVVPGGYLLLALLAWNYAGPISRKVAGAQDPELSGPQILLEHLYAVGILMVGLVIGLQHLGGALSWLYSIAASRSGQQMLEDSAHSRVFQSAFEELVPCLAGVACAMAAPQLGKKLALIHRGTASS